MRKDRFDVREQDFYEALYTQSQAQFGAYIQSGTVVNNYAHIFDLLIRLRQVCFHFCIRITSHPLQAVDHPYLAVHNAKALVAGEDTRAVPEEQGACALCHDPVEDPVLAGCSHAFCRTCVVEYLASGGMLQFSRKCRNDRMHLMCRRPYLFLKCQVW